VRLSNSKLLQCEQAARTQRYQILNTAPTQVKLEPCLENVPHPMYHPMNSHIARTKLLHTLAMKLPRTLADIHTRTHTRTHARMPPHVPAKPPPPCPACLSLARAIALRAENSCTSCAADSLTPSAPALLLPMLPLPALALALALPLLLPPLLLERPCPCCPCPCCPCPCPSCGPRCCCWCAGLCKGLLGPPPPGGSSWPVVLSRAPCVMERADRF